MGDRKLYSDDGIFGLLDYGAPGVSRGLLHAASCATFPDIGGQSRTILVIGGGNNYETIYFNKKGWKTYGLDLRIPRINYLKGRCAEGDATHLPFKDKQFDLVFCTEVMEHVPEEISEMILKEVKRVARKVYFTISTINDSPFNTHINIHHATWWISKFENLGFGIITASMYPMVHIQLKEGGVYAMVSMLYPDGVVIYANCECLQN